MPCAVLRRDVIWRGNRRTEPAEVFDCKAGYEDWEHLWSPAKQQPGLK